jgi:hypothetical protein
MSDKAKQELEAEDAGATTELSDQAMEQVAGGVSRNWEILRQPVLPRSPFTNNIGGLLGRRGPLSESAFKLTIPGPSFVQVQSAEKRETGDVQAAEAPTESALEIFQELSRA